MGVIEGDGIEDFYIATDGFNFKTSYSPKEILSLLKKGKNGITYKVGFNLSKLNNSDKKLQESHMSAFDTATLRL